jgi:predicted NUDIX family NTP pyrophosphohydrolase
MRASAGILLFKRSPGLQFFLVHPGGPFWKGKDAGAWSIPKGEFVEPEPPEAAAIREFREETGTLLAGELIPLSPVRQKAGKWVHAFALEGDIDPNNISSNSFSVEWPYRSGRWQQYPEVDEAAWFTYPDAIVKINPAQVALLDELVGLLSA